MTDPEQDKQISPAEFPPVPQVTTPKPPKEPKESPDYKRKYGSANPLTQPQTPQMVPDEEVVAPLHKTGETSSSTETPKPTPSPESALGQDSKPTDPTPPAVPQPTGASPLDTLQESQEKERARKIVDAVVNELRPLVRNQTFVEYVVKVLCEKCPELYVHPIRWRKSGAMDLLMMRLSDDVYLRGLVPTLWIMLGDNIKNVKWAAMVCASLTFNLICIEFPAYLHQTGKDRVE